jgi:glyoxylase-like metal-dependent hydrolase (beta-lactamase superfamily II)
MPNADRPFLFRQLFEPETSTFTYLVASRRGGEALLLDPVREEMPKYAALLGELDVRLVFAVDTHVHADHVTALGALRELTECATVMGSESRAECVSRRVVDGEVLRIDGIELHAIHTPGHTDDSYSFRMPDRVFTGDTLLIGSTGRTDFQNGDPAAQYESLFGRLLRLPNDTLVYPAHDYRGATVSTIGHERAHNPRLAVATKEKYVAQMRSLVLPPPKWMDVAVPANLACGSVG